MENYNHKEIESKWQKKWAENSELYSAKDISNKPKKYILDMFPYPSGDGLHIGHVESYTATDIISRYFRMRGFNVLHPQGWDAFGLPAENFAIKTGTHPDITTHNNIKNFTRQIKSLGMSYDWSREIDTSSPEYYKWTQWFFLLLYKNGLAYKKKGKVNWCEFCQTVLANEQAEGGICERCKSSVIQKDLEQWFFKITDFIEPHSSHLPAKGGQACKERGRITSGLLDGLEKLDWPESIKAAQRNWIGKSEGTVIKFSIFNFQFSNNDLISNDQNYIEVFTTRVDTIFGCTYCVVAPEHKIVQKLKNRISNWDEVEKYIQDAKNKTDLERMETKEKTGVEIKGIKAVNPFNGEKVPIFVADYVLGHYGTGAVMAVPAHDERDFEFAKKYNLSIRQSITPNYKNYITTIKTLSVLKEIYNAAENKGIKFWLLGGLAIPFYAGIIYRNHSDIDLIAKDEKNRLKIIDLFERLGFEKMGEKKISENVTNFIYKKDEVEIDIGPNQKEFELTDDDFENNIKKILIFDSCVLSFRFIKNFKEYQIKNRDKAKDKIDWEYLNGKVLTDDGELVESGEFTGLKSKEARQKMAAWLEKNNLGERKVNYKIRDWLVSRQRYWGAPIPIIYCKKCGMVAVPEKDLPVVLPIDVDFKPTGESPLKYSKIFQDVKCPNCGGSARRESDTMDTFVCSSWYYLRYADPKNEKEFAEKNKIEKWLPVDLYVGGAEHAVLHLLYARFFTKVLHSLGIIDFDEPFLKLRNQGMILAEDGRKMSKSLGNVVNPDQVVEEFGADSLRMLEMFMGPLEDPKPWNTKGIIGLQRFLDKVWRTQFKVNIGNEKDDSQIFNFQFSIFNKIQNPNDKNLKFSVLLNKTIKKVTEDIELMRFNTAISAMMILANEFEKQEEICKIHYTKYLILLSPFAPHIAEELWNKLGNKESIFLQSWPEYDPELIQDEEINLVVQINGKIRDILKVSADISEEEAKKAALGSEKIKKHLAEKEIKKIIFIKNKLINIVV